MIPLKLEISNFLSYRKRAEIDFSSIHLACISGSNGAGKSSILDAITWAMFGQSRAKSDDDVVNRVAARKGESAEVCFTFEQEGVLYRVIRRKAVNKSGSLEFQIATDGGEWKTLTGSGIRQTQETVKSTLNMNYDTFINASFLLQGKADEFTTKTPDKRKEILADVLGVNDWDRYKELATDQRKLAEGRLQMIETRQKEIDSELSEKPSREAKLAATKHDLELITTQLNAKTSLLEQARKVEAAVNHQRQIFANLGKSLEQVEQRLAQLSENLERRQDQFDDYQELLNKSDEINEAHQMYINANEKAIAWQKKAEQYNALITEMHPYEVKIESERATLIQRKSELEQLSQQITKLLQEESDVQQRHLLESDRLKNVSQQIENLKKQEEELSNVRFKLHKMLASKQIISKDAELLRQQLSEIASLKSERIQLIDNKEKARVALMKVEKSLSQQEEVLHKITRATADKDMLEAELPAMKKDMILMKERIGNLRVHAGEVCPLCGQPLSEEHRMTVINQLELDGKSIGDKYRTKQDKIRKLNDELEQLELIRKPKESLEKEKRLHQERLANAEARLEQIDKLITEWNEVESKRLEELELQLADDSAITNAQKSIDQLQKAVEEIANLDKAKVELQKKVSELDARRKEISRVINSWEGTSQQAGKKDELQKITDLLSLNNYANQEKDELDRLQIKVNQLGYDSESHHETNKERDQLASAVDDFNTLEKAKAAIQPLTESLEETKRQIIYGQSESKELGNQLQAAKQQLENLLSDSIGIDVLEEEVLQLREDQIEGHRQVAFAQQNLEVLAKLAQQRKEILKDQESLAQRIRRLQLLEKACSRQGVQALLIERSLPEIEDDANSILAKLSHGQMHIEFRTQRQLKSSDRLSETLDIHISDGVGERPYENYSGGEQFRVNFAIRIALSQLLAKRAGARLQTLVIDEGFGSQDPDGRQRLIEAINTIQDDFKRIFVITHIDEMRDAFPNRIEVEKGPQGSVAQVI